MHTAWKEFLWQQFGASIDMLDNAVAACPDDVWNDRSARPEFWYVAYHALFWLDRYLTAPDETFEVPSPFTLDQVHPSGILPDHPYGKEDIRKYAAQCRAKCRAIIDALTDEKSEAPAFGKRAMTFGERLLYNMRHVQHHAGQLNLILRQRTNSAPSWVGRAVDTIVIRPERAEDVDAIRRVNELAFERAAEAQLVDALRVGAQPFVSLVADDHGTIVGHICFTPVQLDGEDGSKREILGLAPMAVTPARQNLGIGSMLVRAGLEECRRRGVSAAVVVGHTEYYPRFGFVPAQPLGLISEYEGVGDAFMIVELVQGAAAELRGIARYHAAFRDVE